MLKGNMVPQTSRPGIRFRNEQSHQDQEGRNFQANETARDEGRANGAGLFCRLAIQFFPCVSCHVDFVFGNQRSWSASR